MTIDRTSYDLKVKFHQEIYDLKNGFKRIAKMILASQQEMIDEKIEFVLAKFFLLKSYGILGFPKFLDGNYIHFITKREKICQLFGCNIYRVQEAKLEVVLNQEFSCLYTMNAIKTSEIKYIEYYTGMDYRYFYFSYDLDLTRNIQSIFSKKKNQSVSRFLWNSHILQEFYNKEIPQEIILPVIYGFVTNKFIKIEMKEIEIGLISRRSRYQVGTRFLKRGIDEDGNVANEVETEFYFIEKFPSTSDYQNVFSYIFYRGSIPIFWKHEKSKISPKPKILIDVKKDPTFKVSQIHFEDLFNRYGNIVKIFNLVKKKQTSSEYDLGNKFNLFFNFYDDYLKNSNSDKNLSFNWVDFFDFYNQSEQSLIEEIQKNGKILNKDIGMFHYNSFAGIKQLQKGIIRTNCVDCLDRTNNSMACISGVILGNIFETIGLNKYDLYIQKESGSVKNQLLSVVFDLFAKNGDAIANQYAGSEAFHKAQLDQVDGNWKAVKHNIAFIAVKRYLSNILTDFEKQKRFDLFLGKFVPERVDSFKDLWDVMDQDEMKQSNCQCDVSMPKFSIFPDQNFSQKILENSSMKFNKEEQIPIPIVINEDYPQTEKQKIEEKTVKKKMNLSCEPLDFEPKLFNFQKNFTKLEKEMQHYDNFLNYVSKKQQLNYNQKFMKNQILEENSNKDENKQNGNKFPRKNLVYYQNKYPSYQFKKNSSQDVSRRAASFFNQSPQKKSLKNKNNIKEQNNHSDNKQKNNDKKKVEFLKPKQKDKSNKPLNTQKQLSMIFKKNLKIKKLKKEVLSDDDVKQSAKKFQTINQAQSIDKSMKTRQQNNSKKIMIRDRNYTSIKQNYVVRRGLSKLRRSHSQQINQKEKVKKNLTVKKEKQKPKKIQQKKIKKKVLNYPKLRKLIPCNLHEQKQIFYEKNENYDPVFLYNEEDVQISNYKPDQKYMNIALKIVKASLEYYGSYSNFSKSGGKVVGKKEFSNSIKIYLKNSGLENQVSFSFSKNRISGTSVVHNVGGTTELIIREPIKYRKNRVLDILNHEIGTHCIRKFNEHVQMWSKKRSKYKLKDFMHIEEGLGCIHTLYERARWGSEKPFLLEAALNYISAVWAHKMSFQQLYHSLKQFIDDKEKLWRLCLRVKRGLNLTEKKGGMYKDQLYLQGAIELLRKRHKIDFHLLYSGKLSIDDYRKLAQKEKIDRHKIILPYFLKSHDEYQKVLDIIATTNFINQNQQKIS